jgi:hypothetical protein
MQNAPFTLICPTRPFWNDTSLVTNFFAVNASNSAQHPLQR